MRKLSAKGVEFIRSRLTPVWHRSVCRDNSGNWLVLVKPIDLGLHRRRLQVTCGCAARAGTAEPNYGALMASFEFPVDLIFNRVRLPIPRYSLAMRARRRGCTSAVKSSWRWTVLTCRCRLRFRRPRTSCPIRRQARYRSRGARHIAALDRLPRPTLVTCRTPARRQWRTCTPGRKPAPRPRRLRLLTPMARRSRGLLPTVTSSSRASMYSPPTPETRQGADLDADAALAFARAVVTTLFEAKV